MSVTELRAEHDPGRIVEELVGGDVPDHPPLGQALVSEVTREARETLTSVAALLRERRRDARPVLVAVPYHRGALDAVSEAYDLTVTVAPHRTGYLPGVKQFLATLCTDHQTFALGDRLSIRAVTVDVAGLRPTDRGDADRVAHRLRADRGVPLHERAAVGSPDAFVFAAPGAWHDVTRGALAELAPVLGGQGSPAQQITAAGLVFEDAGDRRTGQPREDDPRREAADARDGGVDHPVGSAARFPDPASRAAALEELGDGDPDAADPRD